MTQQEALQGAAIRIAYEAITGINRDPSIKTIYFTDEEREIISLAFADTDRKEAAK